MVIVIVISSVKLFWIPYKNVFGGGEYMGRLYKACKEDSKLEVVEETHVWRKYKDVSLQAVVISLSPIQLVCSLFLLPNCTSKVL